MLKQALCTRKNVNVKLATSIFDKQILPIISYGCSAWALPQTTNYMYLDNVPNTVSMSDVKTALSSQNVKVNMCKRIGKTTRECRPIFLHLGSIDDKIKLLGIKNLSVIHQNASVVTENLTSGLKIK